jgi:3-oxoacyl-[acyl-carrier-protein] synthase III
MFQAKLRALAHYLPGEVVDNETLSTVSPTWSAEKIASKTGILERRVAPLQVCSSDLAFEAAMLLFSAGVVSPTDIDLLILCTQSPDYFLPTTACLLQHRLGISRRCASFDFNLGCSGYVYGLGIAKAMLETGQARSALLLVAETYSKFMRRDDIGVRAIFGDAGSATLLTAEATTNGRLAGSPFAFVYGTDGSGGQNLIVRGGGMREPTKNGDDFESPWLHMNGPEIFTFTLRVVPDLVDEVLSAADLKLEDLDLFLFHQANGFMLEHLRRKLDIAADKFVLQFSHCGNTVSSTIPIALEASIRDEQLRPGMKVMLVGFGVGYSWGGCVIEWPEKVAVV